MNEESFLKFLEAYADGRLTDGQAVEMRAMLDTDPEARLLFWEFMEQDFLIREIFAEKSGQAAASDEIGRLLQGSPRRPETSPAGRFSRAYRWCGRKETVQSGMLAACLVTGLVVGAYFLGGFRSSHSREAIAVLRINQTGVFLERNGRLLPIGKEMPLLPDDGIWTDKGGKAEIAFPDTTFLEIGADSSLEFPRVPDYEGKRIRLKHGSIIATVAKQPANRPMAIKTPTAEATVLGTEFQLYVKNGSTRLNVREGVVRFQRLADLTEACVSKGEQSVATRDGSRPLSVTRTDAGAFEEKFEDAHLDSRGWYDEVPPLLSDKEHIKGSRSSTEFVFLKGSGAPTSGDAIRRCFSAAEEVQTGYWIKHSTNWSSEKPVGHVILMTNKNKDWEGTAYTHLTLIIGTVGEYPAIFAQDGQNLDQARLGQDLTGVTELRAVAGGNGDSDGYGEGVWTPTGNPNGVHRNKKTWAAKEARFKSVPGKFYKGDWHHVQVSVRLNSISNGKAVRDGQLKYWVDGELVMDYDDVVLRTAVHSDMQFNQFLIAPYITDGSPEKQTLWLDDLTVIPDGLP